MLRLQVTWSGTSGGLAVSTFHFLGDDDQAAADNAVSKLNAFAESVDTIQSTAITWTVLSVAEVIDVGTGDVTDTLGVSGSTGLGEVATERIPDACQAMINWRTGQYFGGVEVRGRTFIPGLSENGSTNGSVASAAVTQLNSAATDLRAAGAAQLAVWSPTKDLAATVTAHSIKPGFAILRGRRD